MKGNNTMRTAIVAAIVAVLLSAANSESVGPCDREPSFSGNWQEQANRNPYSNGGRNPYDNSTWSQPDPSLPYGGVPRPYPY